MHEIGIQAIGFLGAALFIVSYQIRSNRMLFFCQLLGCIVFCVQFFIMGAYTGVVSLLVNILRNVLLLKADVWRWVRSRYTLSAMLALLIGLTAWTWAGPLSLLAFTSVAVTTVGYWTNNAQKIRLSQLIGSPCTLLYDVLVGSWGGVLSESFAILSILVSIRRFGWRALGEQKQ